MALIGFRYVQSTDPGSVGAGYQWLDTTTANLYERNTCNSAWDYLYNVNQITGGLLSRNGGVMAGAITGVTGWAPLDSPNFTTVAKLNGVNLATMNDLQALNASLLALIKAEAQIAVTNALGGVTGNQNIAIGSGTLKGATKDSPVTIPLPFFPDGVQATQAQCKWHVSPSEELKTGDPGSIMYLKYTNASNTAFVNPNETLTFCAWTGFTGLSGAGDPFRVQYLIVGVR